MFVDRLGSNVGQTIGVRILHDLHRDFGRTLANRGQRWVKASLFQITGLHQTGQFFGGIEEDLLGNGGNTGANHSQRNAREDVRVVALTRVVDFALVRDGIEGRTGREDALTLYICGFDMKKCSYIY